MLTTTRKKEGYIPIPASPALAWKDRRATSPAQDQKRGQGGQRGPSKGVVPLAVGIHYQNNAAARQKDKFVPLPDGEEEPVVEGLSNLEQHPIPDLINSLAPPPAFPGIFEDLPSSTSINYNQRGRITFYCTAESFDRAKLEALLKSTYPGVVKPYPDVFYVEYIKGSADLPGSDIFFFDYGVVACWGLTKTQEMTVIKGIARQCQVRPLPDTEVEVDEFQFNYSAIEKPHVQNDTVTLNRRFAQDHKIKLAISYALAQSTKLSVYEKKVFDIVEETKHLPEGLAETGKVNISSTDIAKLIGKVFLQRSAVNLLCSVLDTPEFFWHAPDSFLALYRRICEYLELDTRVEVLNSRFSVLQEMLDMLRNHQDNHHSVRLEWIVIWLIVVEVIVGLMEVLALFGVIGNGQHTGPEGA